MHRLIEGFRINIFSYLMMITMLIATKAYGSDASAEANNKLDKPRWEAGVFAATFYTPLYPASAQTQQKILPVPFLIYRGERLRIGEDGVIKAMAIEKPHFKVDLSLGAAFNANSNDSTIREGMPDLDFIFEVGPQVSFMLFDSEENETWLNLQVRKVFSTDFSDIQSRGYIFQPEISFHGEKFLSDNSSLKLTISPLFATDKMHQYFYQVDDEFSNSNRSAYQAKGGYLGSEIAMINRFNIRENIMLFVSTKLDFFKGASNDNSPLFEKEFNYSIGVGIKWTLFTSNKASLF